MTLGQREAGQSTFQRSKSAAAAIQYGSTIANSATERTLLFNELC